MSQPALLQVGASPSGNGFTPSHISHLISQSSEQFLESRMDSNFFSLLCHRVGEGGGNGEGVASQKSE